MTPQNILLDVHMHILKIIACSFETVKYGRNTFAILKKIMFPQVQKLDWTEDMCDGPVNRIGYV